MFRHKFIDALKQIKKINQSSELNVVEATRSNYNK